jgi:FkbM family methyltransferase
LTSTARLRLAQVVCGRMQPFGVGKARGVLYPYERARTDSLDFAMRAKTGSLYRGNTADFHAWPFAVSGYGEWRNWAVALALCAPGDVIVEVGANVGTETVGFADIVGDPGRVVAFEPLPANVESLERLTVPNVRVLPFALSDSDGVERFAVPAASMSQGIGHLLGPDERASGAVTYYDAPADMTLTEVQTRTLDAFATDVRGVRLLVADAEGAEVSILRGGREVLAEWRPALVLEASAPHQRRAGLSLEALQAELTALAYKPFVIGPLSLQEVHDPPEHSNWLCLPEERVDLAEAARRSIRRCGLTPFVFGLNPLSRPRRTPTA